MTDSLGFLISDVSRLLRKRFDDRARLIGVTRQQWRTLSVLKRHEGSNQGTLAELLEVEPITLGRMIDRLEEAGWVERRRDPGDRRVWRIHLTEAAQPVLLQLKIIADALFVDAAEGIPPADQAKLHALLEQLSANLSTDQSNEAANG
ncbi:MarR family winged helix-turn-helix transcriptional regulator [Sphingomonas sp.]|jgi:DNA-binding MarR family transcriptional regulator|uniref:MarR family winged helix-turn-helix transcriptional regulator n=1 Tax=Sphingomonas sp. TaxID=28214 RepID=UPI000BC41678|nr:MarR family transcriptional regulator [Sphingomonas sp.]MBA4763422.1 MarR family transcriptional regulator [Sphingomonas sp.]OYX49128.1 MAG: transcriptional regulator [Sphingomonas sp. 32-66-10]